MTANRTHRRSATRKRRAPLALLIVPVVLVALGVVLLLVLGGGADGIVPGLGGGDGGDDTVPDFHFKLAKTEIVATVEEADADALRVEAEGVAEEVAPVLDQLYVNAFLDPSNWREGDYEEIYGLFSDEAATSAREPSSVEILTLGPTAGDVYERVTPRKGSLRFIVLFDQDGNPDTVNVHVRFFALGERQDGTFVSIVSAGQVFLENLGGWKITAFDVHRADKATESPAPEPAPSSSASAS